jgi:hypothetical protein
VTRGGTEGDMRDVEEIGDILDVGIIEDVRTVGVIDEIRDVGTGVTGAGFAPGDTLKGIGELPNVGPDLDNSCGIGILTESDSGIMMSSGISRLINTGVGACVIPIPRSMTGV